MVKLDTSALRIARKSFGLSPAAVAKKLGVKEVTVKHWERGHFQPQPTNLHNLVALFGTVILTNEHTPTAKKTAANSDSDVRVYYAGEFSFAPSLFPNDVSYNRVTVGVRERQSMNDVVFRFHNDSSRGRELKFRTKHPRSRTHHADAAKKLISVFKEKRSKTQAGTFRLDLVCDSRFFPNYHKDGMKEMVVICTPK